MTSSASHPVPRRRRRWILLVTLVVVLPLLVLALLDWRLASSVERIDGAFVGLSDRPAAADDGSVTILLVGTAPEVPGGTPVSWLEGSPDLDSVMLVTIAADRRHARIDWLPLPDAELAGLAEGEPAGAVAAAGAWTGRRVDHLAAVDMTVLQKLADEHGAGVDYVPGAGTRKAQHFMQAVLESTLEAEMRKEPWTLYRALSTVADGTAIDAEWSLLDLHRLAISLRDMRTAQIEYGIIAVPVTGGSAAA